MVVSKLTVFSRIILKQKILTNIFHVKISHNCSFSLRCLYLFTCLLSSQFSSTYPHKINRLLLGPPCIGYYTETHKHADRQTDRQTETEVMNSNVFTVHKQLGRQWCKANSQCRRLSPQSPNLICAFSFFTFRIDLQADLWGPLSAGLKRWWLASRLKVAFSWLLFAGDCNKFTK